MELSKQQDTYMDIQKRRTFIISSIYFGIIGVLCYIGLKKLLPILIPFMAAMAIAAMLEPAVSLGRAERARPPQLCCWSFMVPF